MGENIFDNIRKIIAKGDALKDDDRIFLARALLEIVEESFNNLRWIAVSLDRIANK